MTNHFNDAQHSSIILVKNINQKFVYVRLIRLLIEKCPKTVATESTTEYREKRQVRTYNNNHSCVMEWEYAMQIFVPEFSLHRLTRSVLL